MEVTLVLRACMAIVAVALPLCALAASVERFPPTGPQPSFESPQGRVSTPYVVSHALLISVSSYAGAANGGWAPLDGTHRELDDVAGLLRTHGFGVTRVRDPSGAEMSAAIRDFLAEFGHTADARLILFFSGHGYTNPRTDVGYLVPADAPLPEVDSRGFYGRALPMRTLDSWAREIEARHALFIFDSCFSGAIFSSKAEMPYPPKRENTIAGRWRFFRESANRPVRQFIAAGSASETLPAKSVFIPLFLKALSGEASRTSDGYVTGKEIGLWLEQTVPQFRKGQHPHSNVIREPDLAFGDMVFQIPIAQQDSSGRPQRSASGERDVPTPAAPKEFTAPDNMISQATLSAAVETAGQARDHQVRLALSIDRRGARSKAIDEAIESNFRGQMGNELGQRVRVLSYERMVLLVGFTGSEESKVRLEKMAANLPDTRAVVNEIQVGRDVQRLGDDELERAILARLPKIGIRVLVDNGVVYLMGRVSAREAGDAADLARAIPGVAKVVKVFLIDDNVRHERG